MNKDRLLIRYIIILYLAPGTVIMYPVPSVPLNFSSMVKFIGQFGTGRCVIAACSEIDPAKMELAERLVRAPFNTRVEVKTLGHEVIDGASKFVVRLKVEAGLYHGVRPSPYNVQVVFDPATDVAAWKECARCRHYPPVPGSWRSIVDASCPCHDFSKSISNLKHEQDPAYYCKHVAAAFYVVAHECDKDWRFVFMLSGKDITAQLATELARAQQPSSSRGAVYIDLCKDLTDSDSDVEFICQKRNGVLFVD